MLFNNRDREFSAENVSRELRSNNHSASNQLLQLKQKGLLASLDDKAFKYWPATPELDEKVKHLASIYEQMPVAVVTCIYEKPKDTLKSFSDAFKFKKD